MPPGGSVPGQGEVTQAKWKDLRAYGAGLVLTQCVGEAGNPSDEGPWARREDGYNILSSGFSTGGRKNF